jgi:hypothetical protein
MGVAVGQRRRLDPAALEAVRQRQVGQHAVVALGTDALTHVGGDALAGARDGAEARHHALGRAGRARGVEQHGQLVLAALHGRGQRGRLGHDVGPARQAGGRVGRQRQRDAGQARGHRRALRLPFVELADEQQAGLGMLEHVAHGLGALGGKDRHRAVAGHPDGQLGDDEMRAVLRQHGDARALRETLGLQVRRHARGLVHRLGPGDLDDLALADGLGEQHPLRVRPGVGEGDVEEEECGAHPLRLRAAARSWGEWKPKRGAGRPRVQARGVSPGIERMPSLASRVWSASACGLPVVSRRSP